MTDVDNVLAAATARAEALAVGDSIALADLLHPRFVWTSHTGEVFDRDAYLRSNLAGNLRWHRQELEDPAVIVTSHTAIVRCIVSDDVDSAGVRRIFRMHMTQTWIRQDGRWACLAGHAGPLHR